MQQQEEWIARKERQWSERFREEVARSLFPPRIARKLLSLSLTPSEDEANRLLQRGGVYFYGPTGSGKTLRACALALEMQHKAFLSLSPEVPEEYKLLARVKFVRVPEFLEQVRQSFDSNSSDRSVIKELLDFRGLLILDDLGAEYPTAWALSVLYILINHWYEQELPVIVTSNLSLDELAEQLDDRIAARLGEMCLQVKLSGDARIRWG